MSHERNTDASFITHPLQHCPKCGSDRIEPVVEAGVRAVHFLCRECGRCWNIGLGAVSRVLPTTCSGCPERGRCLEMYTVDHPDLQPADDS
jgi:transposase-like protein